MIALIGSEGSMGKRYQAILNYLKEPFDPLDLSLIGKDEVMRRAKLCHKYIIATPTHTHAEYLRAFIPDCRPILCEKPITKDIDELVELVALAEKHGNHFQMMFQYKELATAPVNGGGTHYDFFRHGNDGLTWDCLQMIGLANGALHLSEKSPIWTCMINGQPIPIADMDWAYVQVVKKWLAGKLDQRLDQLLHIHKKTAKMAGVNDPAA